MASTAAPLPPRSTSSLFDLPKHKHKRKHRQHASEDQSEHRKRREDALQRSEATSRARATAYLHDFLHRSPNWSAIIDQISIVHDAVPTMQELESYGEMNEAEGTMACRKLFKAVVVWDELGHSLWERLRTVKAQKRDALKGLGPMLRMGVVGDDGDSGYGSSAAPSSSSSVSSSPNLSIELNGRKRSNTSILAWETLNGDSGDIHTVRSHTEPAAAVDQGESSHRRRASDSSRPAIPKICASAMRKTFGVLTDRGAPGRRSR